MEPINQISQERKAYDPPAVVYETELEVHAVSSQSTAPTEVHFLSRSIWTRSRHGSEPPAIAGLGRAHLSSL